MSEPIYIIDGVRTPIGSPVKSMKNLTVAQMGAVVMESLIDRNKIKRGQIAQVIMGNTVSAGTGQNFARQAAFLAGLSLNTPAYVVNNVCGAGLQAVILAVQTILAEDGELVVAGGAESASQTPNLVSKDEDVALKDKSPIDSLIYDGLWCLLTGKHMGELCEALAAENKISRQDQDLYVMESHKRAIIAQVEGKFRKEIVPVQITANRVFAEDERPRRNMSMEKLIDLRPAFIKDGTITAGNASVPCDGACAVLVGSKAFVKKADLKPLARILGYASIAVKPELVFSAGITAINACLEKCKLSVEDIDLFEISEAFAAQAIFNKNKLKVPEDKMNICGGDIAFGHPLGAVGARVLVTLVHALADQKKQRGLCCVCLGGGGAVAMAVERVT